MIRVAKGCLVGVFTAIPLWGCHPNPPPDEAQGPPADAKPPVETGSEGEMPTGDRSAVLPTLTDEALAARVDAQSRLLGRGSLFEDIEGRPVPALPVDLDDDDSDPEGEDGRARSVEDEILDSLPGSAGYLDETPRDKTANGNALGLFVPIEQPPSPALAHFHQALRDLAGGRDTDGKVRIAVYGGSHTEADIYTHYLRSYLQARFGNGGHGFIHLARVNKWYRHVDFAVDSSRHWLIEHAQKKEAREDGFFGLMGASATSSKKQAYAKVFPRETRPGLESSRYEVAYLEQPKGGKFKILADGKKVATVNTKGAKAKAAFHAFELPPGHHTVEVRPQGGGETRLFGLTAEREEPGIVVDTMGISGTRAANMLRWDEKVWASNFQRRDPDLWVMFYGTNEATDTNQPISDYRKNLEAVIDRFQRAAPESSCLLMGPGDFPRQIEEGVWVPRPRLLQIVEVQREVAYEKGCGFWDGVAFMGGPGSMHTWATAAPRMGSRDHIHFTKRGYVRIGMAVADALMVDYDAG